jgi:hypothetical protein
VPRAAIALMVWMVLAGVSLSSQANPQQVKAAFLTKFGQFVQWPSDLKAARSSFDICLAEGHPFGNLVQTLAAGLEVHGLDTVVREISRPETLPGCQILFASSPSADKPLLDRAAGLPILTVGDAPGFLEQGGIINLREVDGRVRFDVNLRNAARVNLQISTQLLRLALTVKAAR